MLWPLALEWLSIVGNSQYFQRAKSSLPGFFLGARFIRPSKRSALDRMAATWRSRIQRCHGDGQSCHRGAIGVNDPAIQPAIGHASYGAAPESTK
jgi:hypothetical protein